MVLLNWAAPGAYRAKVQKWQREVLGEAMVQTPGAIGVLLSPTYYHRRGNLWACEQAHLQMLSSENINTDRMAALLFKGKRDERDSRQQPRRETLSAVLCHWWTPLRLGGLFCGRPCGWGVCLWGNLGGWVCSLCSRAAWRVHWLRRLSPGVTVLSREHARCCHSCIHCTMSCPIPCQAAPVPAPHPRAGR